jgi:hypothetical protein
VMSIRLAEQGPAHEFSGPRAWRRSLIADSHR